MGLRRGEVLGLRWTDVDVGGRVLRVERAAAGGWRAAVRRAEDEALATTPAIPALAAASLERHRVRQAEERLRAADAWRGPSLVFTTTLGTPLEPRNVDRRFAELRTEAGIDWLRLHDLRRGCATVLLSAGVEPRTVMEILGHSTIRLTMDLHGHVLPERMHAAAEAVDRALGSWAGGLWLHAGLHGPGHMPGRNRRRGETCG